MIWTTSSFFSAMMSIKCKKHFLSASQQDALTVALSNYFFFIWENISRSSLTSENALAQKLVNYSILREGKESDTTYSPIHSFFPLKWKSSLFKGQIIHIYNGKSDKISCLITKKDKFISSFLA